MPTELQDAAVNRHPSGAVPPRSAGARFRREHTGGSHRAAIARRMTSADRRWMLVAVGSWLLLGLTIVARQGDARAAYLLRSLDGSAAQEHGPDLLDTPVLPGSTMKVVTLIAALESNVIEPDTRRMCRRTVRVAGRQYTCSHPDQRRPLSASEALAHSCNDFFLALVPRLSRQSFNAARLALGLPPLPASAPFAPALIGLDGPRIAPRALLEMLIRAVGAGGGPTHIREGTQSVVRAGLSGAARYGSAAAIGARGLSALAKTGTAAMPGGGVEGLLLALTPAKRPTRAIVVVAPGGAGLDAAEIGAQLLQFAASPRSDVLPEAVAASTPLPDPVRLGMLQANGRTRVEVVPLEEYVARVVAGEGQPRAADAAQEALAVAVRTFASANRHRHRRDGYDLCDSTHCQVPRPATATTRRAALATAGRVLLHDGAPAFVFYSAWCGGRSALASEVWPGALDYGGAPVLDHACEGEAGWATELTASDLERVLRGAGLRGDRLRNLRTVARSPSGRVSRLAVEGFRPGELPAHELRMVVGRLLGWQHLKSTAFEVNRTARGYRFTGRGYGHGVGLCVIGAGHRASTGQTAEEILRFYYPGLTLNAAGVTAAGASGTDAARPSAAPSVPGATPTPMGMRVLVPAAEEGERPLLLRLLDAARRDIAARAGVPAPPALQVTVHPSVESFGLATGQPWWTAGATLGTQMELLPITMLRQQGQLERTVRHEMAHVIVDSHLKTRPLWVREGAAFYFANPEAPVVPTRRACPSDVELTRPVSVGAQREAHARAEACFRAAIASGKTWREVR